MARGHVPGPHAGDLERNHLIAQQRDHPADRANETRAVFRGPVHGLGQWILRIDIRQRLGQDVVHRPAGHLLHVGRSIRRARWLQRAKLIAAPDASWRSPRRALARRGFRRTFDELLGIGWRSGRPSARNTSRRGVASTLGVAACPRFRCLEQFAQVRQRAGDHPVGNLFGADLEQEVEAHWTASLRQFTLLIDPNLRHAHRQIAHALDHAHPLGDADRAARIEQIKQVRALQHLVIGRQHREALLVG